VAARPARLFISHSSHDPGAPERLAAIAGALKAEGFCVLYDKEALAAGDDWRARIHAMLWECDAAVILLTPGALERPWVHKEAAILGWRAERNPNFRLIPVLQESFVAADLDRPEYGALGLNRLQAVSGTAEEIATEVAGVLAPLVAKLAPTPLDLLGSAIAKALAAADAYSLEQVVQSLGEPPEADEPRGLHRAVARWMLKQDPPSLERTLDELRSLGPLFDAAQLRAILRAVAPLWVTPDIAAWFAKFGPPPAACRHLEIACEEPEMTLKDLMYVAALPKSASWLYFLNDGPQPEHLVDELARLVHQRVDLDGTTTVDAIRAKLTSGQIKVFAAVPIPADRTAADEIRALLPSVMFVFFAAPPLPEPAGLGGDVARVIPGLDDDLERKVAEDFFNAFANL
jgi:hypothetical protein